MTGDRLDYVIQGMLDDLADIVLGSAVFPSLHASDGHTVDRVVAAAATRDDDVVCVDSRGDGCVGGAPVWDLVYSDTWTAAANTCGMAFD
jgi:hypothetical protein